MRGFCYTSSGRAIEKKLSDTLWSKYQEWEQDVPEFSTLRSRWKHAQQKYTNVLVFNVNAYHVQSVVRVAHARHV